MSVFDQQRRRAKFVVGEASNPGYAAPAHYYVQSDPW